MKVPALIVLILLGPAVARAERAQSASPEGDVEKDAAKGSEPRTEDEPDGADFALRAPVYDLARPLPPR